MKKIKRVLVILFIGAVLLVFFHSRLLNGISDYLIVENDIQKSDVIIVLGGEVHGERTKRAVQLLENGKANYLLFSDGTRLSWRTKAIDEMIALAKQLGIKEQQIFKEERSRSTYENAQYTLDIMKKKNWSSAIVVTTAWHTKRSEFMFNHIFAGSNITLSFSPAPEPRVKSLHGWWKDSEKQQIVLTEWAKLIVYKLKY